MVTDDPRPPPGIGRLRCAILAADISGYTRLMSVAEHETHSRFMRLRVDVIQPGIISYRGQIVKSTGDGFIAWFESCLDALTCSLALQREIIAAEADIPGDRRIMFRMALNCGEVLREEHDIYGHEVNVAARLYDFAEPGGVVVSEAVHADIGARFTFESEDLGLLRMRNIARPVHAYLLRPPGSTGPAALAPFARPGPVRPPAVAILPFRDLNTDSGHSYLGDGVLEEVAAALASLHELLVISSTSTLRYRGHSVDTMQIAQELGVRYIITGSMQRSGERLRIWVHLHDVAITSLCWSRRYDGDLDHIFDLQDMITVDVVGTVLPQIKEAELRRVMAKRPDSLDGYDYFLRGVELLRGRSLDEFKRARTMFERAMQTDDSYAPTYAYAAFWHVRNIAQGWTTDPATDHRKAAELSAAAIEREPDNALGLAIHGHTQSFLSHNYGAAEPLFRRALARAPSHAFVLSFSSLTRSYVGDGPAALAQAEKSVRVSPCDMYAFWLYFVLSVAHYANRDFEEAATWAQRARRENSRASATLRMLAASLSAVGRLAEASEAGSALMQIDPGFRLSRYAALCPWAVPAMKEEFLANLARAGLPE